MKLYLAGPLFTTAEIKFNIELKQCLVGLGHECWLPQEYETREETAKAIFLKDVEGIDWAEAVVANMDGPDPDSGTCWECGYAYKKKPIILYRTDFRNIVDCTKASVNLMLTESANDYIDGSFLSVKSLSVLINQELTGIVV
jgi:nucleoside 2-deoxyribosyltransferase